MLPALITRLSATIRANEAAMRKLDRVDRGRLLPFTDRLRHVLNRCQTAKPHELRDLETYLGPNMNGRKVEDWIRQSDAIRAAALAEAA